MSETIYHCIRCEAGHKWELMTSTPEGNLFCPSCWEELTNEAKRKCPVDGAEMKKRLVTEATVVDVCEVCGGTWFDKGELESMLKKAEAEKWNAETLFWLQLMSI